MQITSIISFLIAIFALSIIIFIHELGHFIFAKLFNVIVLEFSIGMGPRIFSFVKNKTRYSLKAIPFGGSCAMVGEDPSGTGDFSILGGKTLEDGKIDFNGIKYSKEELDKFNFQNLNGVKKFFICLAGPLFNFLLAFLLSIILVFNNGIDKPYIDNVTSESPASAASPYKLEKGDLLTFAETPLDKQKIILSRDLTLFMYIHDNEFSENKNPLVLNFIRDNKEYRTIIFPKYNEEYKKSMIGISLSNKLYKANNLFELLKYSYYEVGFNIDSTLKSLKLLFSGKVSTKEISGPVGTVAFMGDTISTASTYGIFNAFIVFINLVVLISANLGVMNLLPIPALDGGRIVFSIYEMITGKKVNPKIEATLNSVTMLLLLLFMMFIFGNDIIKLIIGV